MWITCTGFIQVCFFLSLSLAIASGISSGMDMLTDPVTAALLLFAIASFYIAKRVYNIV